MKYNKLITKALTKSSALLLMGATIIGGASTTYAQTTCPNVKGVQNRTTCSSPSSCAPTNSNCIVNNAFDCNNDINNSNCNNNLNCNIPGTCNTPNCDNTINTPGTSKPDVSKPNKPNKPTKPDTTKPDTTKPDTTKPDTTKPENNGTQQAAFENKVLDLVNAERAKGGLKALQMDENVRSVARLKSQDMNQKNYFSHTSPTYGSPFDMMKKFGINYSSAGENIAQGYTTPEAVVTGWMNSPGHRANIMNGSFTHIGVGYEANGNYWTQMFVGK